jgi:hypothetical protein
MRSTQRWTLGRPAVGSLMVARDVLVVAAVTVRQPVEEAR